MTAAPVAPRPRRVAALRSAAVSGWDMRNLTEAGREVAESARERALHRGESDTAEDQQNAEEAEKAGAHAMVAGGERRRRANTWGIGAPRTRCGTLSAPPP